MTFDVTCDRRFILFELPLYFWCSFALLIVPLLSDVTSPGLHLTDVSLKKAAALKFA